MKEDNFRKKRMNDTQVGNDLEIEKEKNKKEEERSGGKSRIKEDDDMKSWKEYDYKDCYRE